MLNWGFWSFNELAVHVEQFGCILVFADYLDLLIKTALWDPVVKINGFPEE